MSKIGLALSFILLILIAVGWQWGAFVVFWTVIACIIIGFLIAIFYDITGKRWK